MGQILIRQLDDGVLAALKARARKNERSTEAEVRAILSEAVRPGESRPLASLIGSAAGGRSRKEIVEQVRRLRSEWE